MATAFERRRQPNPHDRERGLFRNHALPHREHVRVVMLARKFGGLFIPAERTTHTAHLVRRHRFTVSRTAEDYPALALPRRHRFGGGSNEERVIDRFFAHRAKVSHLMAELPEQFLHFLLVAKAGMIRPERNFHLERFNPASAGVSSESSFEVRREFHQALPDLSARPGGKTEYERRFKPR